MSKKIVLKISDRQMDMINEIQSVDGVSTMSGAIAIALAFYSRKIAPAYATAGIQRSKMTAEERAKYKVDTKVATEKHKADIKIAEKTNICEGILGGTVFKDNSGGLSCRYNNHFADGKDEEQILPLDLVNNSYVEYQFFPDRDTVLNARPELKK